MSQGHVQGASYKSIPFWSIFASPFQNTRQTTDVSVGTSVTTIAAMNSNTLWSRTPQGKWANKRQCAQRLESRRWNHNRVLQTSSLLATQFAMIAAREIHRETRRELLCGVRKLGPGFPLSVFVLPYLDVRTTDRRLVKGTGSQTHSSGADVVTLESAKNSIQDAEFIQGRVSI